jgi:hypothetical protein
MVAPAPTPALGTVLHDTTVALALALAPAPAPEVAEEALLMSVRNALTQTVSFVMEVGRNRLQVMSIGHRGAGSVMGIETITTLKLPHVMHVTVKDVIGASGGVK